MSGGTKRDQQKNRVELICPQFVLAIGRVMTLGAQKYDAHNWMKGISYSRLVGASLRHIFAFTMGQENDPETGESHLAHAACCLMFLFWQEHTWALDWDDRVFSGEHDEVVEQMVVKQQGEVLSG